MPTDRSNFLKYLSYFTLLALILTILGVIFMIIPRFESLKDLSTKISAKEAELDLGKKKVTALRTATQLIKTAQTDMDLLGVAIPVGKNAEEALAQLSANASTSGVSIVSTTISDGEAGHVSIALTLSGDFDGTYSFISNLEKNLRPVTIADYNMIEAEGNIDSTLNLLFPYVEEPKQDSEGLDEEDIGSDEELNGGLDE